MDSYKKKIWQHYSITNDLRLLNVDLGIMDERCRIDAQIRQSQSNLLYIEMIRSNVKLLLEMC